MHSSPEPPAPGTPRSRLSGGETLRRWNQRLHYFLGLYLLCFVWLFAFTGLLLNHSQWKFAEFWDQRREATDERDIQAVPRDGDLAQARDLMRQLGLHGEIEWTAARNDPDRLDLRVSQPGHIIDIRTDLVRRKATVKRIDLNAWGVLRILHTFTGVRADDARNRPDWILTQAWAWTMDAVAVGLIFMVLSSLIMWWELPSKRRWGIVALCLGCLSCGLFCVGLRWLP